VFERWAAQIRSLLWEARPLLHDDVDTTRLARFIIATLEGALLMARVNRDAAALEGIAYDLKRFVAMHLRDGGPLLGARPGRGLGRRGDGRRRRRRAAPTTARLRRRARRGRRRHSRRRRACGPGRAAARRRCRQGWWSRPLGAHRHDDVRHHSRSADHAGRLARRHAPGRTPPLTRGN
jgi:hypothetical protein